MRLLRRIALLLGPASLRVVYDERYAYVVPGVPLDPARGEQVLAFLLDRHLVRRRDVHRPLPTSLRNILLAHTEAYLDSLQDPAVLSAIVGTELRDDQVEQVLSLQRLVTGGTIYSTRLALLGRRPAVHLGGGLHHAGPDRGSGFCAFNDVAIAIRRLQAKGYRRRVLVVDLDVHQGNGTRAVFAADPTVHTYSIHNAHWDESPAVASTDIALGGGVGDDEYLDALRRTLPPVLEAHRPALVVYVAGTDPAGDDALGDWKVTDRGILARDRFVVEQVRATCGRRTPFVVVLGGGYGFGSWRHTARFTSWLAGSGSIEPPDDMELALRRFRHGFRQLDRAAARRHGHSGEWGLSADDLLGVEPVARGETRILGRYTPQGFELLLERLGVLRRLRALGYTAPVVEVDFGSGLGQTVRVFGDAERVHLLIEIRVRRDKRIVPEGEVLFCEWLLLQNPRAAFSQRAPPLPGQQHPGLGLLGVMVALLVLIAERVHLDGVVNTPSHFHVAMVGRKHLTFVDPVVQARFEALADLLKRLSLAEAEQALAEGRVVDAATSAAVTWEPAPMVIPVSDRFRERFRSEAYEAARRAARERLQLRLRSPG